MYINALMVQSVTFATLGDVVNRFFSIIVGISAVVIALLWIPIAIGCFSEDERKRYDSKIRAKYAALGTVIYVLAITGTIYALAYYVVTGV